MRQWLDEHSTARQTLTSMAVKTVLTALVVGLGSFGIAVLVLVLVLLPIALADRLRAREPDSIVAQRLLFVDALETMRIPPEADRAQWRLWLQPTDRAVRERWDRIEHVYTGALLGVVAAIGLAAAEAWALVTLPIALALVGLVYDAWVRRVERRASPRPGTSDREYLLAQLDALERPRDP